jgi:AcrR family transcriptional regulator
MPRVVKEEEFTVRRNEILDAAQRLIFSKGYEQMSIQDILDAMGISKGAFYHYFGSKPALLEALTVRVEEDAILLLQPVIDDPSCKALEKLERFFNTTARWKTANKDYLIALLSVWYHDDNAIVRNKMITQGFRRIMPLIAGAIRQGVREGELQADYTEQMGEVLFSLFVGMGDATARALLELHPDSGADEREACYRKMTASVSAYTRAIEQVLGTAPGSMSFFDLDLLREWTAPPAKNRPQKTLI